MLRTSESETEILLGNKQLLGIFLVVALLLAISFYGGYMVGRGATGKKAVVVNSAQTDTATTKSSPGGGETHVATPDEEGNQERRAAPLGTPKRKPPVRTESPDGDGAAAGEAFAPQVGQQFLQVAAVSRDEAEALADVLHKKGFRAHAVPKPGSAKVYRVIIGPIRDAADLSSTRDALMRTGFREVIPQRY